MKINKDTHYDVYHGMPVEGSDSNASIPRSMVTHLGPLSTLCDLLVDNLLVCNDAIVF